MEWIAIYTVLGIAATEVVFVDRKDNYLDDKNRVIILTYMISVIIWPMYLVAAFYGVLRSLVKKE